MRDISVTNTNTEIRTTKQIPTTQNRMPRTAVRPACFKRASGCLLVVGLLLVTMLSNSVSAAPPMAKPDRVREIFVPYEDLQTLLEGNSRQVFLTRDEYAELLAKAKQKPAEIPAPAGALLLAAEYDAVVEEGRVQVSGTVELEVLEAGLHALPLDLSGVGVRRATLGEASAAIGRDDTGQTMLFVEGVGRHRLVLEMVTPLQTSAAQQSFSFRLPAPAAARLRLAVPGNVEVKSGATVVRRALDEAAGVTRLELLLPKDPLTLVLSLNNRMLRQQRVVVSRSVLVSEVTSAYERLHATMSFDVLHGAADRFELVLPENFEPTEVSGPLLSRWAVATDGDQRVLEVLLREPATGTVILNVAAMRAPARLDEWTMPQLTPREMAGQAAMLGLIVENQLAPEGLEFQGLIPVDTSVLTAALPETVFQAEPGAPQVRPVAAYYAPQALFDLRATFRQPPPRLQVTTNVLLVLDDRGHHVRGGFALLPQIEKLFAVRFAAPAGWNVTEVTAADGQPLAVERYPVPEGSSRIHVRLPQGVPPDEVTSITFQAESVPSDWLGSWPDRDVAFPVFAVENASRDTGAVAVRADDDLQVRPGRLTGLDPLDENEKDKYGLAGIESNLAYRYEAVPYSLPMKVTRTQPLIAARSFSFLQIAPQSLTAHYEILYDVRQARVRQLALRLPSDTPSSLSISGVEGARVKEFSSEETDEGRRWTALLAEPVSGVVRLAVDFQQPLTDKDWENLELPLAQADQVAYQSAVVAVEGSAELDIAVRTDARAVDVGELVAAQYRVGARLLGVFESVGPLRPLWVDAARRPGYGLPPAIVQRAELVTVLSAGGVSQTAARYLLWTQAAFLEVRLPERSVLWSAQLDGRPVAPQQDGDRLLLDLPASVVGAMRDLQIIYQTPVASVVVLNQVAADAPTLWLSSSRDAQAGEVPTADVTWKLLLPEGHRLVRTGGTVSTQDLTLRRWPIPNALAGLFHLAGGAPGLLSAREYSGAALPRAYYLADDLSVRAPMSRQAAAEREELMEAEVEMEEAAPEPRSSMEALAEDRPAKPEEAPSTTAEAPPVTARVELDAAREPRPADAVRSPTRRPRRDAAYWALEGVRSLPIALQQEGHQITFQSLGERPRLALTIADGHRLDLLAWAVALTVFAVGLLLTRRSAPTKTQYVLVVGVAALGLPLITGLDQELGATFDAAFYAACSLAVWYLLAAALRWLVPHVGESLRDSRPVSERPDHVTRPVSERPDHVTQPVSERPDHVSGHGNPTKLPCLWLAVALTAGTAASALAQAPKPPAFDPSGLIELLTPPEPVRLPPDAVIIPYDAQQGADGLKNADRVLVPYEKYVELWNRAFPDQKLSVKPPVAPWSLAGAAYEATLAGDDFLLVTGRLEIEVYADQPVQVPLRLAGGVLASAMLDGRPARLQWIQPAQPAPPQQQAAPAADARGPAPDADFVLLHLAGRGRHPLTLQIRLKLERRGGWRVAAGRLPAAPATGLTLHAPAARTEVRLTGIADRTQYETTDDNEQIVTALGADGALNLQWRPKAAEGQVDRSLTVASEAVLDVQEDGLRLVWQLNLQFPRSRRDRFELLVPDGYLVERVVGDNVQMWDLKDTNGARRLSVTLLKEAADREQLTLALSRRGVLAADESSRFSAPPISVDGAVLHRGRLTIRRSPLLEVRTANVTGLSRAEVAADAANALVAAVAAEESPLGLRPYQAFEFGAIAFALELEAAPVPADGTATLYSLLRIAERDVRLETQLRIDVQRRPVYRVRMLVPEHLDVEQVVAPGEFTWATTDADGRRLLCVYLGSGQSQAFSVVIRGSLGRRTAADPVAAPVLEVLDVVRQQGDLVVQADPAFDVRAAGLQHCEPVLLSHTFDWLQPDQRPLARLALRHHHPSYAARFEIQPRQPRVSGYTITNVKVTDVAVEETISIDLTIHDAGIREVRFTLPAALEQARISAPMLRQKIVEDASEGRKLVRLERQDDIRGQYRVLVENDRVLLAADRHESEWQTAPIPELLTGRTDQRYVTLENAGRDEVVIADQPGLAPLGRQQAEWRRLAAVLGDNLTSAYIVQAEARRPALTFKTRQRTTVQTARASIGLGETLLVVDAAGAYRGEQVYQVHNTTEQFLVVRLPDGARLWTAVVNGQSVKPTEVPGGTDPDQVRIPLIKTAEGDRDYPVVLKYGGRLRPVATVDRVSFPLVRTVNINVELSRVRLRLPQTHTWFDFGGTLRHVSDEGSFEADFFAYNAQQAKRLLQALNTDNPYARARSISNLEQLGLGLHAQHGAYRTFMTNEAFKRSYEANAAVIQQATQQAQDYRLLEDQAAVTDNRTRLNTFFLDQRNEPARNVVGELGGNFPLAVDVGQAERKSDAERFNYRWLERHQLENRGQVGRDDRDERLGRQVPTEAGDRLKIYTQNQSLLGEVGDKSSVQLRSRRSGAAREPQAVGQSQQELARQYQQALQDKQQTEQTRQDSMFERSGLDPDRARVTGDMETRGGMAGMPASGPAPPQMYGMGGMGGFGGGGSSGRPGMADQPAAVPAPQQPVTGEGYAAETHFASLDVDLPQRGREYLFTTPRGDLELTARAGSAPRVERLIRLAALAVGVAVAVVVLRTAARILPVLHRNRWSVAAVLLIGLLSLLLGIFPVLGVMALLYALVQLIRLEIVRRRTPARPAIVA